jgi:hypothetical protein
VSAARLAYTGVMRLAAGARPLLFAALAVVAACAPRAVPAPPPAPAPRGPAARPVAPVAPATQPAVAWRSFPAPHWFEFALAYPPDWTLEPVAMLHDRLLLELVHGLAAPGGGPVARFYVEAERFSGGEEINEWRRGLLATLEQEAWAAPGPVAERREVRVGGVAAVDQRRVGPGGWSRALLIPLRDAIVVLRLVSDGPHGQSPAAVALERRFDEIARRLTLVPSRSPEEQLARHRAGMGAVEVPAGKGAVACRQVVPGHLEVALRDTVSVAAARGLVADLMRRGLRQDDFRDPNLGDGQHEWLFVEDSPYLTIGFKGEAPRAAVIGGDAAHRLARDRRVVRVHHHDHAGRGPCRYGMGNLVVGVELRPGVRVEEILRDYRELIAFPRDIRVMSDATLHWHSRGPALTLLAHRRLAPDLAAIAALRRKVSPDPGVLWVRAAYVDYGRTFAVTFPARYSRREIESVARQAWGEEHLGERPLRISLGLFVGVGREDQWEAELRRRPEVESVSRPPRFCPRPHRH